MSTTAEITTKAAEILDLARAQGLWLTTAESCTGGLIVAALTEIAGSSDVFDCGYVTYSNRAKQRLLAVTADSLARFGAVSEQVAQQMAEGALRDSGADLAVSVTGIAGPGGSEAKPEGRVCFGLAAKSRPTRVETVEFGAIGRSKVRQQTVLHAFDLLLADLRANRT